MDFDFPRTKAARPPEVWAPERAREIARIRLAGVTAEIRDAILQSRLLALDARMADAIERGCTKEIPVKAFLFVGFFLLG